MSNEIVKHNRQPLDVWGADFERAQRMATALSSAAIFPTQFKDPGSCLIVLNMASRLQMDPLEVAQNIDIIHGKPSWKSAYLISAIKASDEWTNTDFEFVTKGKIKTPAGKEIDNVECRFVATRKSDGKIIKGNPVSYAMAIAEGWWGRKDSKWPNMPEQMLQYRAVAFFNRINPSAQLLGMRPADEVEDIEATVTTVTHKPAPKRPTHVVTVTEAVTIDQRTETLEDGRKVIIDGDSIMLIDGTHLDDGNYAVTGFECNITVENGTFVVDDF